MLHNRLMLCCLIPLVYLSFPALGAEHAPVGFVNIQAVPFALYVTFPAYFNTAMDPPSGYCIFKSFDLTQTGQSQYWAAPSTQLELSFLRSAVVQNPNGQLVTAAFMNDTLQLAAAAASRSQQYNGLPLSYIAPLDASSAYDLRLQEAIPGTNSMKNLRIPAAERLRDAKYLPVQDTDPLIPVRILSRVRLSSAINTNDH